MNTNPPPELGHELLPGFGSKEVYERRKKEKQKVYVCYITSGSYSDTEWVVMAVKKDENKAKEWKEWINTFSPQITEHYNKTAQEVPDAFRYPQNRQEGSEAKKAYDEHMRYEHELRKKYGLSEYGDDYVTGEYKEMELE